LRFFDLPHVFSNTAYEWLRGYSTLLLSISIKELKLLKELTFNADCAKERILIGYR